MLLDFNYRKLHSGVPFSKKEHVKVILLVFGLLTMWNVFHAQKSKIRITVLRIDQTVGNRITVAAAKLFNTGKHVCHAAVAQI